MRKRAFEDSWGGRAEHGFRYFDYSVKKNRLTIYITVKDYSDWGGVSAPQADYEKHKTYLLNGERISPELLYEYIIKAANDLNETYLLPASPEDLFGGKRGVMFCITGNKIMRFAHVFTSLGIIGLISFLTFVMIKYVPTCFPNQREALVVCGIMIACEAVLLWLITLLLHMAFDKTFIEGQQIVVRAFYGKKWEYDLSDINKWSVTKQHFRTYWDKVITIHVGKKYLDFNRLYHTNFDVLWDYLESHCPQKQVDIINHW